MSGSAWVMGEKWFLEYRTSGRGNKDICVKVEENSCLKLMFLSKKKDEMKKKQMPRETKIHKDRQREQRRVFFFFF